MIHQSKSIFEDFLNLNGDEYESDLKMIEEKPVVPSFTNNAYKKPCVQIEITKEEQKKANDFLAAFQSKGKCKRGFIVDKVIEQIIQSKEDPTPIIQEFKKICEDAIVETYKTLKKPKIQDYTTFFEILKFPIRFEELKITNIRFKEGIFYFNAFGELFLVIDDSNDFGRGLLQHLLNKGFKNGGQKSIQLMDDKQTIISGVAILLDFELNYPICKIEQLFFPFKHIYHYLEYVLWSEVCNYFIEHPQIEEKLKKWYVQDKKLVNLFKKSVDSLYNIESKESFYGFTFKFYDYNLNSDIISLIYDKYLFSRAYEVEKKAGLYNYARFGEFKIAQD